MNVIVTVTVQVPLPKIATGSWMGFNRRTNRETVDLKSAVIDWNSLVRDTDYTIIGAGIEDPEANDRRYNNAAISAGPCYRLLDRPSSTLYFESVVMIFVFFLVSLGLRGNGDDDLSVSAFVRDRSTVRGGSLNQGNGGFDECSKVSSVKLLCDFN